MKILLTPDEERSEKKREQADILGFEAHLAKAHGAPAPTEDTSKILGLICKMAPRDACRIMSRGAVDDVLRVSKKLALGQILCSSKDADFLSDLIKDSGAAVTLKWLVPLVESVPAILSILSTTVLCTFYLGDVSVTIPTAIRNPCRTALQKALEVDTPEAADAIRYFLDRLLTEKTEERQEYLNLLLEELFTTDRTHSSLWLGGMENVPCYNRVKEHLAKSLEQVMTTTTSVDLLRSCTEHIVNAVAGLSRSSQSVKVLCNTIGGRSLARASLFAVDSKPTLAIPILSMLHTYVTSGGKAITESDDVMFDLRLPKSSSKWQTSSNVAVALLFLVGCVARDDRQSTSFKFWLEVVSMSGNQQSFRRLSTTFSRDVRLTMLRSELDVLSTYALADCTQETLLDILMCRGLSADVLLPVLSHLSTTVQTLDDLPAALQTKRHVSSIMRKVAMVRRHSKFQSTQFDESPFCHVLLELTNSFNGVGGDVWAEHRPKSSEMEIDPSAVTAQTPTCQADFNRLLNSFINTPEVGCTEITILVQALRSAILSGSSDEVSSLIFCALEEALKSSGNYHKSFLILASQWISLLEMLLMTKGASALRFVFKCIAEADVGCDGNEPAAIGLLLDTAVRHCVDRGDLSVLDAVRAEIAHEGSRLGIAMRAFIERVLSCAHYPPLHCTTADVQFLFAGLSTKEYFDFEPVISRLVCTALGDQPSSLHSIVEVICENLDGLQNNTDSTASAFCLDWLMFLDPTLSNSGESGPMWRKSMGGDSSGWRVRCLLTTMLESSTAGDIRSRQGQILSWESANQVSSTTVLEILLATTRQSRRWLGTRDVGKGRSATILSDNQIGCVLEHIVRSVANENPSGEDAVTIACKKWVALIMHSVLGTGNLDFAVGTLAEIQSSHGPDQSIHKHVAEVLISQLCFLKPHLAQHMGVSSSTLGDSKALGSVLDPLIQRALAIIAPHTGEQDLDSDLVDRSFFLIRKLALSHPRRLLRFVPSLAAMLAGSLDTDAQGLLFRRVDIFCDRVVSLIQALRPLVFENSAKAMQTIVAPLLDFLRLAIGEDTRFDSVVAGVAGLLVDFSISNCTAARKSLGQGLSVIDAAVKHCQEQGIGSRLAGRATVALKLLALVHSLVEELPPAALASAEGSEALSSIDRSRTDSTQLETTAGALSSLIGSDSQSAEAAVESLLPWLTHVNASAREAAYDAACALSVQCSRIGQQVQAAVITALQEDDIHVVQTAVNRAPVSSAFFFVACV